jgi:hypothetical protein
MKDLIDKIVTWIKGNILLAIIALIAAMFIFFPRSFRKIFGGTTRRRRRKYSKPAATVRRRRVRRTAGKPLPRSVGTSRARGYPAAGGGTIPFKYNKDGTVKKAWQVGGTLAAKNRMRRLRKAR